MLRQESLQRSDAIESTGAVEIRTVQGTEIETGTGAERTLKRQMDTGLPPGSIEATSLVGTGMNAITGHLGTEKDQEMILETVIERIHVDKMHTNDPGPKSFFQGLPCPGWYFLLDLGSSATFH